MAVVTSMPKRCQQPFEEAIQIYEKEISIGTPTSTEQQKLAERVIKAIVRDVEEYLNNCTNSDQSLASQSKALDELIQYTKTIPGSQNCEWGVPYTPTIQLLNLNNDDREELVLHTQPFFCDGDGPGFGGVSLVYYWDRMRWRGSVIWPCTVKYGCPWRDYATIPGPLIKKLKIRDTQGRAFMLVVGGHQGADSGHKFLSVWRWDDKGPRQVLDIYLSNWCGTLEWELTKEDYIFIPATEKTDRCPAERAKYRIS